MASRDQSICGLDVYKDAICMAQYLPEESSVTSVVINPLPENMSDWWGGLTDELTKLVAELKLTKQDVICSLPAEWALIKKITLDKDEQNIDDSIQWEISQQILGSIDDYVFDHQEIYSPNAEMRHFLVAAFRNTPVKRITKLVRSTKLNPLVVDIDIFALVNLFEINYDDKLSFPAIIVMGDGEKLKFVLTINGEYVDYQIADYLGSSEEFEQCFQSISGAVASLASINSAITNNQTIDIYLAGALFSNAELVGFLQEKMPNIEILYPFRKIACHAEIPEEDLKRYAPQLAVAVGLSIRGGMED